jgi:hypothetical protein
MKGKRKIIAIWMILLLITIPFGIVQANDSVEKEEKESLIPIEITTVDSDKILRTETIYITEKELTEFENTISILMDKIQSAENWQGIKNIINNFFEGGKLGSFKIIKTLLSNIFKFRTYVISSGHGYKLNPIKKGSFRFRKKVLLWHYSTDKNIIKDRTIILKPLALKLRILKGSQFGMVSRFTGMFIYVARKFPQKSYTFFMGMAKRANGIQMPGGS